jgi:hypothetical protein
LKLLTEAGVFLQDIRNKPSSTESPDHRNPGKDRQNQGVTEESALGRTCHATAGTRQALEADEKTGPKAGSAGDQRT